jgi:hypothetical protein
MFTYVFYNIIILYYYTKQVPCIHIMRMICVRTLLIPSICIFVCMLMPCQMCCTHAHETGTTPAPFRIEGLGFGVQGLGCLHTMCMMHDV